jgi:hypothetical protein
MRLLLQLLLTLAASAPIGGALPGARAEERRTRLTVVLRPSELPWTRPDEPEVEVVYRNSSDFPVRFNARSAANSEGPKGYRELSFDIRGPDAKRLDFECRVRIGRAGPIDYVVLSPKSDLVVRTSLECYTLGRSGSFRVSVRFHDENPNLPTNAPAIPLVTGPLESNVITIKVPEGKRDAAQPSR